MTTLLAFRLNETLLDLGALDPSFTDLLGDAPLRPPAADHPARQVEMLAVAFSPEVPEAERDRCWTAIVNLVR